MTKTFAFLSCGFLMMILLVPPGSAAAEYVWTSTADFDEGTSDPGTEYFATNGIDIPFYSFLSQPTSQYVAAAGYVHARTYFVYQGDAGYLPFVAFYDHATGLFSDPVAVTDFNPQMGDGHGAPALFVTPDRRIHVVCCAHFSNLLHFRSTAANSIFAWEQLAIVSTGATYPNLFYYTNTLYITYRQGASQGDTSWDYRTSTNNGVAWSAATTFLELEAAGDGLYVGSSNSALSGTDLWYSFVLNDFPEGVRRHVYVCRWDLSTNIQYGYNGVNLGSIVTLAEANTNCRVFATDSGPTPTNAVWITYLALYQDNPVVLWDQGDWNYYFGGNWSGPSNTLGQIRFSRFNGTAWSAPVNITTADTNSNYMAMIPSSDSIEAFITETGQQGVGNSNGTPDLAFQYSGDMSRWTWNETGGWVRQGDIVTEAHAGSPVNFPAVPYNHHDDIRLMFASWGPDSLTNAEGKIYAWGGAANRPVYRRNSPSGNHGVETSTHHPDVASGSFRLASGDADLFTVSHTDTNTFKWNGFSTGDSVGLCDPKEVSSNALRYEYGGEGRRGCWMMTTWHAEPGDWTLNLRAQYAVYNPSWPTGGFTPTFYGMDQPDHQNADSTPGVTEGFQTGTSGFYIAYSAHFNAGIIARVDDGVITTLDTTVTGPCVDGDSLVCYIRLTHTQANNTVKFERSANGSTWTVDGWYGVPDLSRWIFRYGFSASGPGGAPTYHTWFNVTRWEFDGTPNSFRPFSSWSSPEIPWDPTHEVARNATVTYTGASNDSYIDAIAIVDSDSREVLWENTTDITAGSSVFYVIPESTESVLHGRDFRVRLTLSGDRTGSVVVTSVSIQTSITAAALILDQAIDIFWLIVFISILTLIVVAAWYVKDWRGV